MVVEKRKLFHFCLVISLTFSLLFSPVTASATNFCFIGDSRFVGMEQSIEYQSNITWISKVAMGNYWFWQNTDVVNSLDRDTVIIYEMGVNDLDAEECVAVLKYLRELGFNHVYFTGATPVNEPKGFAYGYSRTNEQIRTYNYEVYCNLPEGVAMMDCYDYLINMGFSTTDGIHYTSDTYQMWFDNIMASL